MKIYCSVSIGNRLLPTIAIKSQNKYIKSTLALCKHPKNENEFSLIHFTSQNKTGTKYKITDNVSCILTRFINEGKATIQLKEPTHDLFIKADKIQLKSFLHLMKRALEKKISPKELTLSSASVTPVSQKNIAPKKLVITKRSEIPIRGFPRTLESLYINEIQLYNMCTGVLQLQKLRLLDLSDNCIEYLPLEINKLPLEELNMARNQLGRSTLKQWNWMGGVLSKTLKILNLSSNNLSFVPQYLVKLQAIVELHIDNNKITNLPAGIGNISNLDVLTVSNNNLTDVPGSMKRLFLEKLDVSNNNFRPIVGLPIYPFKISVRTLKEYSARKILEVRLPYCPATIPYTLVDYLDNAHYCVCGKSCFDVFIRHKTPIMLHSLARSVVSTVDNVYYAPMSCYFCSLQCIRKILIRRN